METEIISKILDTAFKSIEIFMSFFMLGHEILVTEGMDLKRGLVIDENFW